MRGEWMVSRVLGRGHPRSRSWLSIITNMLMNIKLRIVDDILSLWVKMCDEF